MVVPTESFESIRDRLHEALAWLESLKISAPLARHTHYLAALDRMIAAVKDRASPLDTQESLVTLFEVNTLNEIFLARDRIGPENQLRLKLEALLRGPKSYKDERLEGASSHARNTAFELVTAATFSRSGTPVELLKEGDLAVHADHGIVPVECKRASSARNFPQLVKAAFSQLNKRSAGLDKVTPGVVSVDVTKLINPSFAIFECEVLEELGSEIARKTRVIAALPEWRAPKTASHLGAMCRFSLIANVRELGYYTHCAQWSMVIFSGAPPNYQHSAARLFEDLRRPREISTRLDVRP